MPWQWVICSAFFLPCLLPSGGSSFSAEPSLDTQPPSSHGGLCQGTQPRVSRAATFLPPALGVVSSIIFCDSGNTLPFSPRLALLAPVSAFPPCRVLLGRAQPRDIAMY